MNSAQINTVNVIEFPYRDRYSFNLYSFPDTDLGNEEADKTFVDLVRYYYKDVEDEELDIILEEGFLEIGESLIIISHSEKLDEVKNKT